MPAGKRAPPQGAKRPSAAPEPSRKTNRPEGANKAAVASDKKTKKPVQPSTAAAAGSSSSAVVATPPRHVASAVVFVGSYHNVASALSLRKAAMTSRFTARSHVGSVAAVATCSKFLVSAGSDESICIQAVRENGAKFFDLGKVMPPSQPNALIFPDSRFLLCAMDDGTVIAYKTRDWTCGAVVKAHDRAATGIAAHPSGLLAVTVGNDHLACVLDLTRFSVITHKKLDRGLGMPTAVAFAPDGACFIVKTQYALTIYDTATTVEIARAAFERDPPNEIHAMAVAAATAWDAESSSSAFTVIVGVEAGSLHSVTFDPAKSSRAGADAAGADAQQAKLLRPQFQPLVTKIVAPLPIVELEGVVDEDANPVVMHPRVRDAKVVGKTLFTATSVGLIQVFDLGRATEGGVLATERVRHDTAGRITCIGVFARDV